MRNTEAELLSTAESSSFSRRAFVGATGALLVAGHVITSDEVVEQRPFPQLPIEGSSERESLQQAQAAVKKIKTTVLKISREIWNKPAVGLHEQEAMELHIRELEAAA